MANARPEDPYRQFRYRVEIKGITEAQFSDANVSDSTQDPIEYRVGNEPITPRKLPGLIKYGDLTLKWGITDNMEMWEKWRLKVEEGKMGDARVGMAIVLIDEEGNDTSRWEFVNCWPKVYKGPDLSAKGSDVAMEEVTIVHEGMKRVK